MFRFWLWTPIYCNGVRAIRLYPQLWYVSEVAFAKLLSVYVAVNIDGFFPDVAR
jgi:hypothetical protein